MVVPIMVGAAIPVPARATMPAVPAMPTIAAVPAAAMAVIVPVREGRRDASADQAHGHRTRQQNLSHRHGLPP